MHTYLADSPAAISRLLALAMIVDGHISPSEVGSMHRTGFLKQVKVDDDTFDRTVRDLCEDLLNAAANRCSGIVEIDPGMVDQLLLEIREPLLQICVLQTMADIIQADGRIDSREMTFVRRAGRAWFGMGKTDASPAGPMASPIAAPDSGNCTGQ